MIETCMTPGCYSAPMANYRFCSSCSTAAAISGQGKTAAQIIGALPPPPPPEAARHGRRQADIREGENSGGDVDYYRVFIADPKRSEAYMAECEDIIEALGMTFHEGNAFKSVWRKAAQRTLGHLKRGNDQHGIRDSEKVAHAGKRMTAQAQREARKETAGDVRAASIAAIVSANKGFGQPVDNGGAVPV